MLTDVFSYLLLEYYYLPICSFFSDYDKERTVGVSVQRMLLTPPWHRIFCIFKQVRVCSAPGFFPLDFLFRTLFVIATFHLIVLLKTRERRL